MPTIFVERADPTARYAYAIGSTQQVAQDIADHSLRHSWGALTDARVPAVQTGTDTEKVATNGGTGGGGAVSSVAGRTGAVTLATTDLTDGAALNTQVSANTTAIAAKVATASVGVANGVAALDGAGKVPVAQLPAAVQGALNYQGAWNASTNSPTLTSSTGTKGFYYTVGTAGATSLDGITQWSAGDHASFNGTVWEKLDGLASEVISVAGRTGAVTVASTDLTDSAVLNQQTTDPQTGTTYTLVAADAGENVDMNNAAPNTLTIPPNSAVPFPQWTLITVTMAGAGITTIAAGAGVTINKPAARTLAISAQYETATLYKVAADTWRVLVG